MEVLSDAHDNGLILGNALDLVRPLSGDLNCCLDRLGTSVHWQNHVEAEELGDKFGKAREDIVVESSRTQGQSRSLFCQSLDKLGVAMPLVNGTVCGELNLSGEVYILRVEMLTKSRYSRPSGSQTLQPCARAKTMGRGW